MNRTCALGLGAFLLACSSSSSTPADTTADAGAIDAGPTISTANGTLDDTVTLKSGDLANMPCHFALTLDAVEDRSAPWICPDCQVRYRATPDLSAACITKQIGGFPASTWWFGWAADGRYFHGIDNSPGFESIGTARIQDTSADVTIAVDDAKATSMGTGHFDLSRTPGDGLGGFVPAAHYACGWPKGNVPAFDAPYRPKIKDKIADAVLVDQCGDNVRLHDLLGRFLVLHMNQTSTSSCTPCSDAAKGQAQFEADMITDGIETLVVSILVPDYRDARGTPRVDELKAWTGSLGVKGVALGDRGFGGAVVSYAAANGDVTKLGFPAFALIGPDGTILAARVGYDDTVWSTLRTEIHAFAGR